MEKAKKMQKTDPARLTALRSSRASEEKWVVLRCEGKLTVDLEEALVSQGFRAWTPRHWWKKRLPRRQAKVWVEGALIPSFLFLPEEELKRACNTSSFDRPLSGMVKLEGRKAIFFRPSTVRGKVLSVLESELIDLRTNDQRAYPGLSPIEQKGEGGLKQMGEEGYVPINLSRAKTEDLKEVLLTVGMGVTITDGILLGGKGQVVEVDPRTGIIAVVLEKSSVRVILSSFQVGVV